MQWENIKSAVRRSKPKFLKSECLSMSQILLGKKLKTFMLFLLLKVFLSETKDSSLTNTYYQLQGTRL